MMLSIIVKDMIDTVTEIFLIKKEISPSLRAHQRLSKYITKYNYTSSEMWLKNEKFIIPDGFDVVFLFLLLLLSFFLSDILPTIYHERQTYFRTEAMRALSLAL